MNDESSDNQSKGEGSQRRLPHEAGYRRLVAVPDVEVEVGDEYDDESHESDESEGHIILEIRLFW